MYSRHKMRLCTLVVALVLTTGALQLASHQVLGAPQELTTSASQTTTTTIQATSTDVPKTTNEATTEALTTLATSNNNGPKKDDDADEMATSVASDKIGVDETITTTATVADDGEEAATNDDSLLPGIEGKSISHSAPPENENSPSEHSGKLTEEAQEEPDRQSAKRPTASAMPSSLNLTQIDEIFTLGRREEAETVEAWHRMSRQLKKGISGVIGALVPFALNMSQEAKISSNCSGAMLKWVLSMNQLKGWALRMLDASGKPIAGLLEGSMTMFGNYRQCLKIRAPDDDEIEFAGEFREYFRGKYCTIQAKPWLPQKQPFYSLNTKLKSLMPETNGEEGESSGEGDDTANPTYDRTIFEELSEWLLAFNYVQIRFDLCVPSLCSREDIQKAVNFMLRGADLKARVARCESDLPAGKFGVAAQVETGSLEVAEALAGSSAATTLSSSSADPLAAPLLLNEHGLVNKSFAQLGWIIIPMVALALVMVATLLSLTIGDNGDKISLVDSSDGGRRGRNVDVFDEHEILDSSTPTTPTSVTGFGKALGRRKRLQLKRTIKSLSLKRSVSSHLNVDYDQLADDKPLALYGLRFLLVLWVILVESAVNLKFEYLRELMMLKDLIFWWPMQFIINSSLQYDSFILLTAFTMAYKNCLNSATANNARSLTRFVADKYVRLMPSIMLMVALTILLPLAYRGPVWNDYVAKQSAVCQSTGWLNSIFLQNYLPYSEICMPQTWLLCVELQLVLIMAPIVYYLNKSYTSGHLNSGTHPSGAPSSAKIATLQSGNKQQQQQQKGITKIRDASKPFHWLWTGPGALLMGCVALGACCSFYNVYSRQLPPSWFYTMADPDSKALYFGAHLTKLWTHLAVFAIGLLGGVECRRAARNAQRGSRQAANISNYLSVSQAALGGHPHKSHSSSASSLPTILTSSGQQQLRSNGSESGGSSVSISINRFSEDDLRLARSASSGASSSETLAQRTPGLRKRSACCQLLSDLLGLMIAITIMAALIFATHDWSLNGLPTPLVAGLFDVGSRLLWSLAFLWILYKLSVPQQEHSSGGSGCCGVFALPARALGHPAMIFLGKLSFLIYIIHPFVHTTVLAIQEQPIYSSWLMMFHILIGNITITVILAALISLFVEMPCRNVFRRCGTSLLLTQSTSTSGVPTSGSGKNGCNASNGGCGSASHL